MNFVLLILVSLLFAANKYPIIPLPKSLTEKTGTFSIDKTTRIFVPVINQTYRNAFEVLVEKINITAGYILQTFEGNGNGVNNTIVALINDSIKNPEGYTLSVKENNIVINAKQPIGIFYAVQTIRQLLPPEIEKNEAVPSLLLLVPCVEIEDEPRFVYRGFMLDVCRHWSPHNSVKRYIDLLALHKFNNFHWHLTEDQGWRIEIRKWPKLTEVGAWRGKTNSVRNSNGPHHDFSFTNLPLHSPRHEHKHNHEHKHEHEHEHKHEHMHEIHPDIVNAFDAGDAHSRELLGASLTSPYPSVFDNAPYGGFYTQEQIKEVVAYAEKRFINIVPEIEMPGHALAALAAYPQLSCTGGPFQVATSWGIFSDVFCAKNETFAFLEDVLTEVIELFPGKLIHIGGDECPKGRWTSCERCKQTMKENSISNAHNLQSYFIKRIETFVNSKGKRIIGWDEIMEGGLAPNAAVMSWRGTSGGIEAARSDHDAVMTPMSHCYFDFSQERGATDLARVYTFDPLPANPNPKELLHIIGGQANLWRERVPDEPRVEYMMFPRASALVETLWSPKSSLNFDKFMERLLEQLKRYDVLGINYCKSNLPKTEGEGEK